MNASVISGSSVGLITDQTILATAEESAEALECLIINEVEAQPRLNNPRMDGPGMLHLLILN